MRLPDNIERAIQEIEADVDRRPGQHAGSCRLHSLRFAIEDFMKKVGVKYDGSSITSIRQEPCHYRLDMS